MHLLEALPQRDRSAAPLAQLSILSPLSGLLPLATCPLRELDPMVAVET